MVEGAVGTESVDCVMSGKSGKLVGDASGVLKMPTIEVKSNSLDTYFRCLPQGESNEIAK